MNCNRNWLRPAAVALVSFALLVPCAWSQSGDSYYHFQLEGNLGYMRVQGSAPWSPVSSPGGGFTFGYRPTRHFLVESGLEYLNSALFPETDAVAEDSKGNTKSAKITDHTVFIPIGGRVVLPLQHERVLLSAGGGVGIVKNFERAVGDGQIDCNGYCTSRNTTGPYETVNALFMFDKAGHFGAGMGARFSQVKLTGGPWDEVERKNWLEVTGTMTFRF